MSLVKLIEGRGGWCGRWFASRGLRFSSSLAVLPAGLMAFAPLFWQYHTQAEVPALACNRVSTLSPHAPSRLPRIQIVRHVLRSVRRQRDAAG